MIKKIKRLHEYISEYGIKCFIAVYLSNLFSYSKDRTQWRWRLLQKKHQAIKDYLFKNIYTSIDEVNVKAIEENLFPNCIWTAWLQGEDKAPEVIRLALSSKRINANGHRIIVLTNNNIDTFITVPDIIKSKHDNGIIGNAHYTDVIRMMILARYGGIWLDATVLLNKKIDEAAFTTPFYSFGFEVEGGRYVSNHKWLVGAIGGIANSIYLSFISQMLNTYWEKHKEPIDYFVFDYCITLLYENNSDFKYIVDKLPRMKHFTNALRSIINEPYNESQLQNLLVDNQIYILTYKREYLKNTLEGEPTNYYYLCLKYLA